LVCCTCHLPLQNQHRVQNYFYHPPVDSGAKTSNTSTSVIPGLRSVYDSLQLNLKGMSQQAFDYAKKD
jgi:hypothetical protein